MGASRTTSRKRIAARRPMPEQPASFSSAVGSGSSSAGISSPLVRTSTLEDLKTLHVDASVALSSSSDETGSSSESEGASGDEVSEQSSTSRSSSSLSPSKDRRRGCSPLAQQLSLVQEVDVEKYMRRRKMSRTQEHWNAYTMLPSPLFCLYYILSAQWMPQSLSFHEESSFSQQGFDITPLSSACFSPSRFHSMPSSCPLPVLFVGLAIILHAPFSFLYHYQFAHRLHDPLQRTEHLSRRLDQAMIHAASALMSYGTSGSLKFFLVNCIYNCECFYRQLAVKDVKPRVNQIRIIVSILAYTMPIVKQHNNIQLFVHVWMYFLLSGWFFLTYPIGGWSHAVFHLVIAMVVPLLMTHAGTLPASQAALQQAVWCRAIQEQ